eukprot:TRINITY_DN22060_c0_g1_i1.p1 TRINITY_DN22060_c0_g1~~TRINITY_DN22060_c0_g1_i1.p1  ORF type:complete len:122 (+),score=32.54 TRINITY_DN22060_c0_g1_i1:3-368(+)
MGSCTSKPQKLQEDPAELLTLHMTAPDECVFTPRPKDTIHALLVMVADKLGLDGVHANELQLVFSDVTLDHRLTLHAAGLRQEASFQVHGVEAITDRINAELVGVYKAAQAQEITRACDWW